MYSSPFYGVTLNPNHDGLLADSMLGRQFDGFNSGLAGLVHLGGLGDQVTNETASIGGVAASILALSPTTGPAAPFIAAAAGLVALFGNIFSGCGQTCVMATTYANQAETQLKSLKAQYFAQPVHYQSMQTAYLRAFDQVASWIQQMCGNPALGDAGRKCISERFVHGGTAPWCTLPNHTGCDYVTVYRDPVANDPNVVPDGATPTQSQANAVSGSGAADSSASSSSSALFLIAGLAAVLLLSGGN